MFRWCTWWRRQTQLEPSPRTADGAAVLHPIGTSVRMTRGPVLERHTTWWPRQVLWASGQPHYGPAQCLGVAASSGEALQLASIEIVCVVV
jgi:hypothetical protein